MIRTVLVEAMTRQTANKILSRDELTLSVDYIEL